MLRVYVLFVFYGRMLQPCMRMAFFAELRIS